MTMKLDFHEKTLSLLGIQPKYSSQVNISSLLQFQTQGDVTLPDALHQWFTIEGSEQLFEQLCAPHTPASSGDIGYWMRAYPKNPIAETIFPILFENQGVWHMAIPLGISENPPVYIGYYEDAFDWRLHAPSFSDCIYAFAWDYSILHRNYRIDQVVGPDRNNWIEREKELIKKGPETRVASAWFVYDKFIRYQVGSWRKTLMFNEQETTMLTAQVDA